MFYSLLFKTHDDGKRCDGYALYYIILYKDGDGDIVTVHPSPPFFFLVKRKG